MLIIIKCNIYCRMSKHFTYYFWFNSTFHTARCKGMSIGMLLPPLLRVGALHTGKFCAGVHSGVCFHSAFSCNGIGSAALYGSTSVLTSSVPASITSASLLPVSLLTYSILPARPTTACSSVVAAREKRSSTLVFLICACASRSSSTRFTIAEVRLSSFFMPAFSRSFKSAISSGRTPSGAETLFLPVASSIFLAWRNLRENFAVPFLLRESSASQDASLQSAYCFQYGRHALPLLAGHNPSLSNRPTLPCLPPYAKAMSAWNLSPMRCSGIQRAGRPRCRSRC